MIALTRRAMLASTTLWVAGAAMSSTWPSWAKAAAGPDQPLRELHHALEATMRAGHRTPFPRRFDALVPVVDQVFDLKTVLKVAVGPRWDSMNEQAQARLLRAYRRFTVATYVASFDRDDGERFRILPGARYAGTDQIVGTEIISGGGERLRLDYVMRDGTGTWRAVDILVDGSISRVAVQRADFRKILASGDAEALIASLHRKVSDLSDGALNS